MFVAQLESGRVRANNFHIFRAEFGFIFFHHEMFYESVWKK